MSILVQYWPYIFCSLIAIGCLTYFWFQQNEISKDTKLMQQFFSKKTWLLFRYGKQQKVLSRLFFLCIAVSIFMVVTNAVSLYFYFQPKWLAVNVPVSSVYSCVLTLVLWILYFVFLFLNTDNVEFEFRNINSNAMFLYQYQPIYGTNIRLSEAISRFSYRIKRLNNDNNWVSISDLLLAYMNLIKAMSKNKRINSSGNETAFAGRGVYLSFREMMQIVNDYFNSYEIDIIVHRKARLESF